MRRPKKILFQGRRGKLESQPPPCDTNISLKSESSDLLNLNDYQKVHPFVKTLFKETRETFLWQKDYNIF